MWFLSLRPLNNLLSLNLKDKPNKRQKNRFFSRYWFLHVDFICLFTYRISYSALLWLCILLLFPLFWHPAIWIIHLLELELCHLFVFLTYYLPSQLLFSLLLALL